MTATGSLEQNTTCSPVDMLLTSCHLTGCVLTYLQLFDQCPKQVVLCLELTELLSQL